MFIKKDPFKLLARRWRLLMFVGLIVVILSLTATLFLPMYYRADAQVLIISKSRYGVDPYTVVKSAERVAENISQVIKTQDFYNKVFEQPGYKVDKSQFEKLTEKKRRKLWQKSINTSVVYGTGILNVSVYHIDKQQAKELAGAVVSTLAAKGWEYVGGDVTIKVVNEPISTNWPAKPNVILNSLLAFISGILVSGVFVLRKFFLA